MKTVGTLLLALLMPLCALAQGSSGGQTLTVLFTGDNGGEVAPCG